MLTMLHVSFLYSARSALSSPYSSRPWDTSRYCNAPHVNASYYQVAEEAAELVHLTILMQHHKVRYQLPRVPCRRASLTEIAQRTPVALVPNERGINDGIEWDCSGVRQFTYDDGSARLSHLAITPPDHPFAQQIWSGSCKEGQLTAGGFDDSKVHGKVRRCSWVFLPA